MKVLLFAVFFALAVLAKVNNADVPSENMRLTVYFRDSDHPEETREDKKDHLVAFLRGYDMKFGHVELDDPKNQLVNDFRVNIYPPEVNKMQISRKYPRRRLDLMALELLAEVVILYEEVVGIYWPGNHKFTEHATEQEIKAIEDWYNPTSARKTIPHYDN